MILKSCSFRNIWYISTFTGFFSQVSFTLSFHGTEAGWKSTITIASSICTFAYGAISVLNSKLHPPGMGAAERTMNWWTGLIVLCNGKFIIEPASCLYAKRNRRRYTGWAVNYHHFRGRDCRKYVPPTLDHIRTDSWSCWKWCSKCFKWRKNRCIWF